MDKNAESAKIVNVEAETREKKSIILKEEIKKIEWLPKKALLKQTGVVIALTAALGLYIAAFDSVGKALVSFFVSLV